MSSMNDLITLIKSYGPVVAAFSGGCDSTLLLYAAVKTGFKVRAVTFHSIMYPESELSLARDTARLLGVEHEICFIDHLAVPGLAANPENRCYLCKKRMFSELVNYAREGGYGAVIDGSNADDLKDYRPGMAAAAELGIKSPLAEAGFTKNMIRDTLKEAGLSQWSKPSFACYFSRFPYKTEINPDMVKTVDSCEVALRFLGLLSARVRCHGNVARIETNEKDLLKLYSCEGLRKKVADAVKKSGFVYVALDIEGYRTGSMNETIAHNQKS